MAKLPISVNISTYMEEKRIGKCIDAVLQNEPKEIIVIDAGSTDCTCDIARAKGATVYVVEKKGLAYQRNFGIKKSNCKYIAMVDAHDELSSDCFSILLKEMLKHEFTAIQAFLKVRHLSSYWQKAYFFNSQFSLNTIGETKMVGRPCIYEASKIQKIGFDPFFSFGVGCEDVDISIQFELHQFKMGKGTGTSQRDFPLDFKTWWAKWVKYGKGDAHIIAKYPHKKAAIRKHQLITYPITRSFNALLNGGIIYIPFFIMFGLTRFIFSLKNVPKINKNKK